MTRGIKHEVDRWINDMQSQYFEYPTEKGKMMVQMALRPIQLWEIVFPAGAYSQVVNSITEGFIPKRTELQLPFKALRNMLGIKKCPEPKKDAGKRIIYRDNVAIYPIGVKKDKLFPKGHKVNGVDLGGCEEL